MMALGVIRAARELGLSVPGDVAVVGFDDAPLAEHADPPLTTVRQDKFGIGAAAAKALVGLIESEAAPPPRSSCPWSSSCDDPAARAPSRGGRMQVDVNGTRL